MERDYQKLGQYVIFVDEHGTSHNALVTNWFGTTEELRKQYGEPTVNLLYVCPDPARQDQYGQQIERRSSVIHGNKTAAHGMYWLWPGEVK